MYVFNYSCNVNFVAVTITEKNIEWLKINNDQIGYYRVNYPQEMWLNLIEQLKLNSDQVIIYKI